MATDVIYTVIQNGITPTSEYEIPVGATSDKTTIEYHNDNDSTSTHNFAINCTYSGSISYGISNNVQSNFEIAEGCGLAFRWGGVSPNKLTEIYGNITPGWYGRVLIGTSIWTRLASRATSGETAGSQFRMYVTIDFLAHLHYDANTGTGAPADETWKLTDWSEKTTVPCQVSYTVPTLAGYTFMGWSTTQYPVGEGTKEYEPGDNISLTASVAGVNHTFYAVWAKEETYTSKLLWDMNGGIDPGGGFFDPDIEETSELEKPADRRVNVPNTVPRWVNPGIGYCRGWSTTQYPTGEGSVEYAPGTVADVPYEKGTASEVAGTTLYAVWAVQQVWSSSIYYRGNGGVPVFDEAIQSQTAYIKPTDLVTFTIKSDFPVREPHEDCVGWATSTTATEPEYNGGESVQLPYKKHDAAVPNLTLYAVYKDKLPWQARLKFDANGGTGTFADLVDDKLKALQPADCAFTIPSYIPAKEHAAFKGWATSPTATVAEYSAGDTISIAYEAGTEATGTTLYAVYKNQTKYTATLVYNAEGGTGGPRTQTFEKWSENPVTTIYGTISPNIPRKSGYRCVGWSDTSGGVVRYKGGDSIPLAAEYTTNLYAIYKKYNPKVYAKYQGGWKPAQAVLVYKNGVWKDITQTMYVRHNRVWKKLDTSN